MFGEINNKQNIIVNNEFGKLLNNPKFKAISYKLNEDDLYILIKKNYKNNNRENLLHCCNLYNKYKYSKYLDEIKTYIT